MSLSGDGAQPHRGGCLAEGRQTAVADHDAVADADWPPQAARQAAVEGLVGLERQTAAATPAKPGFSYFL